MSGKRRSLNNDSFFIREDFLLRCQNADPTVITKYSGIISDMANHFYEKNKNILIPNGYDSDDMISCINLLVMYYHHLYSPNSNDKYFDKAWQRIHKKNGQDYNVSDQEWEKIVRSDMINFIKSQLVTLRKRLYMRNENISASKVERKYFEPVTSMPLPASPEEIAENPEDFGYKEISKPKFMDKIKTSSKGMVSVEKYDVMSQQDYEDVMYTSNTYSDPADRIIESEEDIELSKKIMEFEAMDKRSQNKVLSKFVKENKRDKDLKKEISAAKKRMRNRSL